jgi:hypothetical protein
MQGSTPVLADHARQHSLNQFPGIESITEKQKPRMLCVERLADFSYRHRPRGSCEISAALPNGQVSVGSKTDLRWRMLNVRYCLKSGVG